MAIAHSVFKQTVLNVNAPPVAATHDQSLLQNDTIALSVNLWSRSFCIVDKTVFFLGLIRWPALACVYDSVPA